MTKPIDPPVKKIRQSINNIRSLMLMPLNQIFSKAEDIRFIGEGLESPDVPPYAQEIKKKVEHIIMEIDVNTSVLEVEYQRLRNQVERLQNLNDSQNELLDKYDNMYDNMDGS